MQPMRYTIRGATVFDGLGTPGVVADVCVADGRISAVGRDIDPNGTEIDASGLALAPGFIDAHTHDDRAVLTTDCEPKISQGVTTSITGNCGMSLAPLSDNFEFPAAMAWLGGRSQARYERFGDYLDEIDRRSSAVNVAALVGHATLRVGTMSSLERPASETELEAMRQTLADCMHHGAIGLSTGLEYEPAIAAPTTELIALAHVVSQFRGVYASHLRDESDHVIEAISELFTIVKAASIRGVISHHKCSGVANFGRSVETLAHIEDVQASLDVGLDVGLDAYPYDACSTILTEEFAGQATRTLITSSRPHPEVAGGGLEEIAARWGTTTTETIARLSPAGAVYFDMDEADVRRIIAHPLTMIGSDGLPGDRHPHPRLWGTFARVIGHYARDLGLFPIEEAVRKMTSLPAARFGLHDRGRIAPGMAADLVLFDPATLIDTATFSQPKSPANGIETVWVNGKPVWANGHVTGVRSGVSLRPR
jgi:N-acyl-D-amino-acid deacylase